MHQTNINSSHRASKCVFEKEGTSKIISFFKKKRNNAIVIIVVVLCIAVSIFGYFTYLNNEQLEKQAADQSYKDSNTNIYAMGENITLDSKEAESGEDHDFSTSFGWEGVMQARLDSATLYNSPEQAGLRSDDVEDVNADGENCYLECAFTMTNIDAVLKDNAKNFNIYNFKLCRLDDPDRGASYPYEIAYFSGKIESVNPEDGYEYTLDKGQEKTFKLGYMVPADSLDGDFAYYIGVTNSSKYQIPVTITANKV